MEEMLGARDRDNRDNKDKDHNVVDGLKSDLEYLHELLLCYLQLNPEDAHKDIISAFTDLVICILSANPAPSTSATPDDEHSLEGRGGVSAAMSGVKTLILRRLIGATVVEEKGEK